MSNDKQSNKDKIYSPPLMDNTFRRIRRKVSLKKKRYQKHGFDLDLSYITPNLIASGFPSSSTEALYRNPKKEMVKFLETFHSGRYYLWNLCTGRAYSTKEFHDRVNHEYHFHDHQAPVPFDMVEKCCASIHDWLTKHPENVAIVHCKAGKGRTGVIISCYLIYSGLRPNAEAAMDFYAIQRTYDLKGVNIPSQRRYVQYFGEAYLRHNGKPPLLGQKLRLQKIHMTSAHKKGFTLNLIIYQNYEPIFNYGKIVKLKKYKFKENEEIVIEEALDKSPVLDGDYLFEFTDKDKKVIRFWFNTHFIRDNKLELTKWEIDTLWKDKKHKKVPENFKLTLFFENLTPDLEPQPLNIRVITPPEHLLRGYKEASKDIIEVDTPATPSTPLVNDITTTKETKPEEPKQEEPKQEEPKQEEPKQEEETNPEEPKQEEPKQEESKQEEPKNEEIQQDESKQEEETKPEEPKQEEPKQEEEEPKHESKTPKPEELAEEDAVEL